MKINAIQCSKCGYIIFSRARHDFQRCKCKSIFIDGGFDYTKVSFKPGAIYRHIELNLPLTKEQLYEDYNLGKNKYGLIKPEKRKGKRGKK